MEHIKKTVSRKANKYNFGKITFMLCRHHVEFYIGYLTPSWCSIIGMKIARQVTKSFLLLSYIHTQLSVT